MISLVDVTKQYAARTLFEGVNVTIGVDDRIGLVGPNGSGKTTLLEILAGSLEPDRGTVSRNRHMTVGYLRQEVPKYTGRTLMEEMIAGHVELDHLERRLELLEEEMRGTSERELLETLTREHGELQRRFDAGGGYDLPGKARRILGGLAFRDTDFGRPTSAFSGGWLMRLALARLLLTEPGLLLLDEPTNYLDLESVVWLEAYLRAYEGAMVIVSHDREFLNALCRRILEVDAPDIVSYAGNFDDFVRARELREEGLAAQRRAQEREIAETRKFVERFRYKATKARQVQSRIKRLEKMELAETRGAKKRMRLRFPSPPVSARVQLELRAVGKSYGELEVYRSLDLKIERGERIVLVGPNGAGKSTLLKMVAGVLEPTRGEIALGRGVVRGYHAQHQVETLDFRGTIFEEISRVAPALLPEDVRRMLGRFLFSGDDAFKPVGVLSGGEKARVAFARILAAPPNLLLLDEPTSHLDMPSIDILADALEEYEGTLIMISHDRHFIRRLAGRVIEVGGGTARSFLGRYDDYLEEKAREQEREEAKEDGREKGARTSVEGSGSRARRTKEEKRRAAERRNERARVLKPLEGEVAAIEAELEALTARLEDLEEKMADPAHYARPEAFEESARAHRALKEEIDEVTARWEERATRLEAMQRDL